MMNWPCTKVNEFEIERFDNFIVEVDDFDNDFFGIEAFGRELEVSFLYFF